MGLIQIDRDGIGTRLDVTSWPFGDAQQQDDLVADPRGRGVEDRYDLERRKRRLHVARGDQWILRKSITKVHALCDGSSSSSSSDAALSSMRSGTAIGAEAARRSMTSRINARTRFPMAGHAISLPYPYARNSRLFFRAGSSRTAVTASATLGASRNGTSTPRPSDSTSCACR